ncbi:MAG: hypothetical protein WAV89_00810 [Ignavibacteriaceae bacterium]
MKTYHNNIANGSVAKFELNDDAPTKTCYSHDGKFIAFEDTKGIIHILNAQSFEEIKKNIGTFNFSLLG